MTTRVDELTEIAKGLADENDRLFATMKSETKADEGDGGVGYVVSTEDIGRYRKNMKSLEELHELIEAEKGDAGSDQIKAWLAEPAVQSAAVQAAAEAAGATGGSVSAQQVERAVRSLSLGEAFTSSDEFKDFLKSGAEYMNGSWIVQGKDLPSMNLGMEQKDVFTASVDPSSTRGFGTMQRDPLVPLRQRMGRVRDLFPVVGTIANLIDYYRVSGYTNNASVVPERAGSLFAPKPQSTLEFTPHQAPIRTIAHYEVAHRNVLADEPQLQGIINNELLYGLRLHEDYQLLQGTGNTEDIEGLLNVEGISTHTQASISGDTKADAVRRAITKVTLAYYEPTGVVLHPLDWEDIELIKTTQGAYVVAVSVAVGADKRLWRNPVVETPAIPELTGLTGAFGLGATVYDREQGSVRISEHHSDYFIRNAIAILAEERIGMAVKRPESFCKITLTA